MSPRHHDVMLRDRWERFLRDDPDAKGSEQHVLLMAATYGNRDGTDLRASVPTLARVTGRSERTVERALAFGRRRGYLLQERRGHRLGNGTTTASEYRLTLPTERIGEMPRDGSGARSQPATGDGMRKAQPATGDGMSTGSTRQTEGLNPPNGASQPATGGGPQGLTRFDKGSPPPPDGDERPRVVVDDTTPAEDREGMTYHGVGREQIEAWKAQLRARAVERARDNGKSKSDDEPATPAPNTDGAEEHGADKLQTLTLGSGPGADEATRAWLRLQERAKERAG